MIIETGSTRKSTEKYIKICQKSIKLANLDFFWSWIFQNQFSIIKINYQEFDSNRFWNLQKLALLPKLRPGLCLGDGQPICACTYLTQFNGFKLNKDIISLIFVQKSRPNILNYSIQPSGHIDHQQRVTRSYWFAVTATIIIFIQILARLQYCIVIKFEAYFLAPYTHIHLSRDCFSFLLLINQKDVMPLFFKGKKQKSNNFHSSLLSSVGQCFRLETHFV